jgi:hypothetical protein
MPSTREPLQKKTGARRRKLADNIPQFETGAKMPPLSDRSFQILRIFRSRASDDSEP